MMGLYRPATDRTRPQTEGLGGVAEGGGHLNPGCPATSDEHLISYGESLAN